MFNGTKLTLNSDVDQETYMFGLQKIIINLLMHHLVHTNQDMKSRYAYFNNKTLKSILRKKIYSSNLEYDVKTSKILFLALLRRECMARNFF